MTTTHRQGTYTNPTGRHSHATALRAAEDLRALLLDGCERIEIAGSIRRGALDVKDIELVTEAKFRPDLFGGVGDDMLNEVIRLRVREKRLQWRGRGGGAVSEPENLEGRRYYALIFQGIPVDLFHVRPPAQWGAILAIRTGPADYARNLVTRARERGFKCEDGRLLYCEGSSAGEVRATPTEQEFIEACGYRYLPPHQRR